MQDFDALNRGLSGAKQAVMKLKQLLHMATLQTLNNIWKSEHGLEHMITQCPNFKVTVETLRFKKYGC